MRSVARVSVRLAAAAAAAVLLTAGCSGGSENGEENAPDEAGGSGPDGTVEAAPPSDGTGPSDGTDELNGVWGSPDAGTSAGTLLNIGSGVVTLIEPDGACFGGVVEAAGERVITVTCPDTVTGYGTGVPRLDGDVLTVAWGEGPTQEFTRLADAEVDLGELDLSELEGLDGLENLDPAELDLDGIDWEQLDGILPGGQVELGGN